MHDAAEMLPLAASLAYRDKKSLHIRARDRHEITVVMMVVMVVPVPAAIAMMVVMVVAKLDPDLGDIHLAAARFARAGGVIGNKLGERIRNRLEQVGIRRCLQ